MPTRLSADVESFRTLCIESYNTFYNGGAVVPGHFLQDMNLKGRRGAIELLL